MKNKIAITIAILCISLKVFSVGNEEKKDTLLYFEIDIRSKTNHPIIMSGVLKNFDYSKLSQMDGKSFIESFYRQGFFVPNLLAYDDVIGECIRVKKDSTIIKYTGQGQKLLNLIAGNAREIKVILDNGENVFMRITEITGLFLICSKVEVQLPITSNEVALNEIDEIVKIYVPLEISEYRKPSRKCIKEMTK